MPRRRAPAQPAEETRKTGWLLLKGKYLNKSHARFFELDLVSQYVSYFTADALALALATRKEGSFDLEGATIHKEDTKTNKFRLSIRTKKGRTYVITAADEPTRDSWLSAFTKARDSAQRADVLKESWQAEGADAECMACIADLDDKAAVDEDDDNEVRGAAGAVEDENANQIDIYALRVALAAGDELPAPGSPTRGSSGRSGGGGGGSVIGSPADEMLSKQAKRKSGFLRKKQGRNEDTSVPLGDLISSTRPVLLLLLRQFGCMLCRRSVGHVVKIYPRLEELGIQVIAVGSGNSEAAAKFASETNFPGRIVTDQSRALYRAFNCKRGIRLCLGKRTLAAAKLARNEGYSQGQASGDLYQLGGVFLLSRQDGILFQHISMFAGDSADLREMLAAAEAHVLQHTEFDPWSNIYALRLERRMLREGMARDTGTGGVDSLLGVSAVDISAVCTLDVQRDHALRESVLAYDGVVGGIMAAALRDSELPPFESLLRDVLALNNDVSAGLQIFIDVQRDRKASWVADPVVIVVEEPSLFGRTASGGTLSAAAISAAVSTSVAAAAPSAEQRNALTSNRGTSSQLKLTTAGVVADAAAPVFEVPPSPALAFDASELVSQVASDGIRVMLMTPQRTVCLRVARSHAAGGMRTILSRAKLSLLEVPEWIGMRGIGVDGVGRADMVSLEYLRTVGRIDARTAAPAIKQLEQRAEDALAKLGSGKGGVAVGMLYVGRNQGADAHAVWRNQTHSAAFQSLLELLGDEIDLIGYTGFAHGLARNGDSGTKTFGTTFRDTAVVFHVATLIPLDVDRNAMMRSLTIAKDPVVIVFAERDAGLVDVTRLRTESNQVLLVVRPANSQGLWELEVVRDDGVPPLLSAAVEMAGEPVKSAFIRMLSAVGAEEVRFDSRTMVRRRSQATEVTTAELTSASFGLDSTVLRTLLLTLCVIGERAVLRFGSNARRFLERDRRWLLDQMIGLWKVGDTLTLSPQAKLQAIVDAASAALDASAIVPGSQNKTMQLAAAASAAAAAASAAVAANTKDVPDKPAEASASASRARPADLVRSRSEATPAATNTAVLSRTATIAQLQKANYERPPPPLRTIDSSSEDTSTTPISARNSLTGSNVAPTAAAAVAAVASPASPASPAATLSASPSKAALSASGSSVDKAAKDISSMVDIDYEELVPGEQLGRGYFGEVRSATWNGTPVACKVLYRESFLHEGQLEMFVREAMLLSKLKHPHITQYLGVAWNPVTQSAVLVTELMSGGSLLRRIYAPEYKPTFDFVRAVAVQVARGMVYLHQKKLIHRDLSSNNILLDNTRDTRVKIADFGLSIEQSQFTQRAVAGPLCWMSPEMFRGQPYTKAIDVFSFGVVVFETATATPPHVAAGMELEPYARAVALHSYRAPIPSSVPLEWQQLIVHCWAQRADARPSFEEVLVAAEAAGRAARVAAGQSSDSALPSTPSPSEEPLPRKLSVAQRAFSVAQSMLTPDDETSNSSGDENFVPYAVIHGNKGGTHGVPDTPLEAPYDHVPSMQGTMDGTMSAEESQSIVSMYLESAAPPVIDDGVEEPPTLVRED